MNPIMHFSANSRVAIQEIKGDADTLKRLEGMGVVKNACIEILQNKKGNSLILIKLGNRRLAIRCSKSLQIVAKQV